MNQSFNISLHRAVMTLLAILFCALPTLAENTAKAVLSGNVLTFYYDDADHSQEGTVYGMDFQDYPDWAFKTSITTVVFDESFKDARPTTTKGWFCDLTNLTKITGIEYLNTSEVTSMYAMFSGCKSLSTIDVSNFNTEKVENMNSMFANCTSLITLDVSSLNTAKVEYMADMFNNCTSLTTLDLSNFNTANVTAMFEIFYNCSKLKSLDLSSFNTENVTNMYDMFHGCESLTTINVSSFNTENVTNMDDMFHGCSNLKTIIVSSKFTTGKVTSSGDMFSGCTQLVGGNGTTFSTEHTDASYACIDADGTPGYFADYTTYAAKAVLSGPTLTFYYDSADHSQEGTVYGMNSGNNSPEWANNTSITTVVFDESFKVARPTTTYSWFSGLTNLTTITDIKYLNTSEVTNMGRMFASCNLTTLDLRSFNTAKVEDMSGMFEGCSNLENIIVSSKFTTGKVTSSNDMFSDCPQLVGGNGTPFSTDHTNSDYACIDAEGTPGYFCHVYTAKAVLNDAILTFYSDDADHSQEGTVYEMNSGYNSPGWANNGYITTVVFDKSFKDARPTTAYYWFYNLSNLTTITGIEYLNTSEVTSMYDMFSGCNSLTTIDVSSFNTAKVKDMRYMFSGCEKLTSLNVSSFNTENVEYMTGMFGACGSLTTLDLSNFNTAKVEYMEGMFYDCGNLTSLNVSSFNTASVKDMHEIFYNCSKLKSLDLSSFNTANVTTMGGMFFGCDILTTLDLRSFNTASVKSMNEMFYGCDNLKTIIVSDGFTIGNGTSSDRMFYGCTQLVGSNGTKYSSNNIDASYAHIDAEGTPGYFSHYYTAKAVLNDATLTFYYDTYDHNGEGTVYGMNSENNTPEWANNTSITTVVFDESFKDARPTTTYCWFYDFEKLTTITGIEYLNTSEVTSMFRMFYLCENLTTLDLSHFNTAKLKSTVNMFSGCKRLTTINMSNFNTENVTNMGGMFNGCVSLTTINVSNFNTAKVEDMEGMFVGCESLTSLDLSKFNTENVENMYAMFGGCKKLTSLDVSSFNTAKVTDMSSMFHGCESLTTLDLRSFNTANVTNMGLMFYGCSNLKTIIVSSKFTTGKVTSSDYMFSGCTQLVGSNGTTYSSDHTDASYARIDVEGTPGYFCHDYTAKAVLAGSTLTFYYDDADHSQESTVYEMNSGNNYPEWAKNGSITTVVFDESFKNARPTTASYWFYNLSNLTTITDIEYLNTSEVTNMFDMFTGCERLTSLDVSSFNTAKVEYMGGMFDGCNSLTTLDLSNFNTAKLKSTVNMFSGCKRLTTIDMSNFNTENVTYMAGMFDRCNSLTTIDVSSFNTAKVKDMGYMFYGCDNLKTIIVSDEFTTGNVTSSDDMFSGCTQLVGGNGTTYSTEHTDVIYACIDAEGTPGYFTYYAYTLANDKDNTSVITSTTGSNNVVLSGRTLYRDGYWNTLCLPFGVNLSDTKSPLYGAVAMELNSASFEASTGTLTLGFATPADNKLVAGTPYIIKWEDTDNTLPDLINPVFQGVTFSTATNDVTINDVITFKGTYGYRKFAAEDRSILFMGAENTLYYPQEGAEIGACRAYFKLEGDLTAGDPAESIKAINLNFGDETTSIRDVIVSERKDDGWYTLDGVKFTDRPTKKGIYVRNGKKVVIK